MVAQGTPEGDRGDACLVYGHVFGTCPQKKQEGSRQSRIDTGLRNRPGSFKLPGLLIFGCSEGSCGLLELRLVRLFFDICASFNFSDFVGANAFFHDFYCFPHFLLIIAC